jgi:ketosteroid isomerase-like protein
MKLFTLYLLAALSLFGLISPVYARQPEIQKQSQMFLDAYARGDRQAILSLIDKNNIVMYGSDAAEIIHGSDALLSLLTADQQLWGGSAHFGPMEHISIVQTRSIASIFFDVSFSVGGRPPVPVRVAAVWKQKAGRWLLVQSSNSVVTEHQSATELLHGH